MHLEGFLKLSLWDFGFFWGFHLPGSQFPFTSQKHRGRNMSVLREPFSEGAESMC